MSKSQKIAILGDGVEGKSVKKFWRAHYPDDTIRVFSDFSNASTLPLENFDLIFRSPSVPPPPKILSTDRLESPKTKPAKPLAPPKELARWTSVTKYFFARCPATIIGVTGTKGKGTTCAMTQAILQKIFARSADSTAKPRVFLVGNIGTPALDILDDLTPNDFVIYELSSFQLWDLSISPPIAAILKIEPDHLNVHADFNDYQNAKANLVRFQTPADRLVFFAPNPSSARLAALSPAKTKYTYPVGTDKSYTSTSANSPRSLDAATGAKIRQLAESLTIPGPHNRENAEAAILLASLALDKTPKLCYNIFSSEIQSALAGFPGLPHRCQFVRRYEDVDYYDDNYCTVAPALKTALAAFEERPIVLIAGGQNKNLDLAPVKQLIFHQTKNLAKVILIGEIRELLAADENPNRYEFADSLADAVRRARHAAHKLVNPVVLMSPAATSFDMFKNATDRGNQFQAIVKSLRPSAAELPRADQSLERT